MTGYRRTARVWFLVIAMVVAVATGAMAQSAQTSIKDPALAKRFNDVSDRLVCQCGCNMVLRVCNHQNCPSAIPMRHEIEKQLTAGVDDDTIVQSFVTEYGVKVLSSPPTSGFDLAAWVMPGFALLIGMFFAFYMAAKWAAKRKLAAASAPVEVIDPEIQKRIEKEMKSI
jgi:cytochrome c-type biogenesis protein CcmH